VTIEEPGLQSAELQKPTNYPQGDSNPLHVSPKAKLEKDVTENPSEPLAHSLAREKQIEPDLALLICAWPNLPPTVKRMILAALEANDLAE
jgi:hypothetical protein